MPTYLMLTTLTPQGVQTLKANPSRLREVNRDVEELGREGAAPVGDAGRVRLRQHRRGARRGDRREGLARARRPRQREAAVARARSRSTRCSGTLDASTGLAKARARARRAERALRQPRSRLARVELLRRDVVRRVGVEERGEVLDLAPARPELELAAAVDRDPALGACVVEVEQVAARSRSGTASS